jgi:CHAT domain-containing protein
MEKFNYAAHFMQAQLELIKQSTDDTLQRLYDAVFAPVETFINVERVIIIPHGPLHYVPFHALHDGDGYLIDRMEISYAPSAAVLKLCRERSAELREKWSQDGAGGKGDFLALGVADSLAPNISDEVNALKAIFPDGMALTGKRATRENLFRLAPDARFLHFASHGSFQRDNPMFSFLQLADCRLSFYNLLDLKLKSEIVTLSACQTGLNAILPGDELHGLMRGFLYAGAPSLVVSLWTVSDKSTSELMKEMYLQIRACQSKRSALRRAQLAIREAYNHPYYWAPFVLMGSPD